MRFVAVDRVVVARLITFIFGFSVRMIQLKKYRLIFLPGGKPFIERRGLEIPELKQRTK